MICGILRKGNIYNIAKVKEMKVYNKKVVKAVVALSKKGVKDDINSTGSPWAFQPKMPKGADKFKKTIK